VYDGATAAAEAVIMCKERQRKKAIISETVHPQTIDTIRTYCSGTDLEVIIAPAKEGVTDLEKLSELLDGETACVLIQQPNYYGQLEEGDAIGAIAAKQELKFILSCHPISLGTLKATIEYG